MDSKEDDDISIDFGKVKNFFKGKEEKKPEQSTESASHKQHTEDDDISIDFGKVKNFFKSEKKEEEKHIAHEHKKDSDELSFDFSKIKSIFKSSEKEKHEEEAIDLSLIMHFFKKYGVIFIALIPILLSIYVRMQAGALPFTDDWAANSIMNNVRSQIRSGIDQQYPNLPDANKQALVDTELQKVIGQNKAQIDNQIIQTSSYIKTFFQDEQGKNYMPDIDPYYWYRYSKNIIEKGHPGDTINQGREWDSFQLAPNGRAIQPDMFHPFFLAYFYKFLNIFVPDLTIMRSIFYYPVFVAALSVLLVFLIGKKIAGNIGGFFAGVMMAINAAFLGRTLFGHGDSDAWVVFFPLLITWLFVVAEDLKNNMKILIVAVLAGFFTGIYTLAWNGWWHIFDFLLVTLVLTLLYLVLVNLNFKEIRHSLKSIFSNSAVRHIAIVGAAYLASTAIFVTIFLGWKKFISSVFGPLIFSNIKAPVTRSLWPNVLTTVAELNEGSINGIINSVGGPFLFFIGLLGLVFAITRSEGLKKSDIIYIVLSSGFYGTYFIFRRSFEDSFFSLLVWIMLPIVIRVAIAVYKKDSSYDFKLPILLSLWFISTIYASIKGIRFTLLLAPAFSVAFGVALGKAYMYLSRWSAKELNIQKFIGSGILILVFIFVFYVNPIKAAISAAGSDIPLINDAWYNTLNSIKQNSKENAIITSWWDFGHHFKALAERPVTFDGTTQTDSASHWVGRLFMTDNEIEAVGILRMLDCGHNRAYSELLAATSKDPHRSLKILKEIILLDKGNANKKLQSYGFGQEQISKILSYTHCEPPEAFVIASEDMIGKSGVWSHFGSWNFERADIWFNVKKLPQEQAVDYMMKKFNYTKERAENIYYEVQAITSDSEANAWVAPWPGYGGEQRCSKDENNIFVCGNGLQIDMSNFDVFAIGQQGTVRPKAAAFTTKDGIIKKSYDSSTVDFGITVVPESKDEILVVLSSKELTGSMFTRLFHMQGHGLRYFKLFNHQRGLTGTDIYTYKVDWEGKNMTIVDDYADFFNIEQKIEAQNNSTNSS